MGIATGLKILLVGTIGLLGFVSHLQEGKLALAAMFAVLSPVAIMFGAYAFFQGLSKNPKYGPRADNV